MNKFVGAHVSSSGGVQNAPLNAMQIGAKAFALFTKNQKRWDAKPLETKDIDKFKKAIDDAGQEVSTSFDLTVNAVDDAPVLDSIKFTNINDRRYGGCWKIKVKSNPI